MRYAVGRPEAKTGRIYDFTKCSHVSPLGEKCGQRGIKLTDEFYNAVYEKIINDFMNQEYIEKKIQSQELLSTRTGILNLKKLELREVEEMNERLLDLYLRKNLNEETYMARSRQLEMSINDLKKEISLLDKDIEEEDMVDIEEVARKIAYFKENWLTAITTKEKNDLLKSVVKVIYYDRCGDEVKLEIEYL